MKGSVLFPTEEFCIVCGNPNYDVHHAISGNGRRKVCDRYGLTVPLCRKHHEQVHSGGCQLKRDLQEMAQMYYEENIGTREQWIKDFGKSWLD